MPDERTCGQRLAEHSTLPLKLAELTAAVAEVLELHTKALNLEDENGCQEQHAYLRLVEQHRQTAARLRATGDKMAGYRDLPMGRHDERALADRSVIDAFANLVRVERELLALLEDSAARHAAMLSAVGDAASAADGKI